MKLINFLIEENICCSMAEAKRLIQGGLVSVVGIVKEIL